MIVLGIDTSSRWSGVALAGEEGLIGEFHLSEGGRTEHLHLLMVRLFEAAGLAPGSMGGIAVSLGPGSFTGLRIGLGAAKGLALASGCPVVGLPIAPVLASSAGPWDGKTAVWIDAGRGEVYGALYHRGVETGPGDTSKPEGQIERAGSGEILFLGSGADRYRDLIEESLGGRARFAPSGQTVPVASLVALHGLRRLAAGESDRVDDLEPLYLRDADARPGGK